MQNDTLTEKQGEAMDLDDGLVVAGAGAGKTRTLIAKIIHDQENGIDPKLQIVVTFTNAAANEIRERLDGKSSVQYPFHLGTLHALSMRWIRRHWGDVTVIDDKDFEKLIRSTCKRTRINVAVSVVRGWINERPKTGNGGLLVKAILADLRGQRLIHPDVMLSVYLDMLHNSPVTQDFRIYVDEAQDGSAVDYAIYSNLSKSGKNAGSTILFGDPRQAVYGFRGAKPELFVKAMWGYGEGVVELSDNFRSSTQIVDVANQIGEQMGLTISPMKAIKTSEGVVKDRGFFNSTEEEVQSLAHGIKYQLEQGHSVAVLTRYNAVADAAAAILRAEGIDVERPGHEVEQDPSIERLKALKALPVNWTREMNLIGVPFALQDRLLVPLQKLCSDDDIGAAIDEALDMPSGKDRVWLSTVHGAKGLEWDDVFLIGADHISFYADEPEDVRLAYVAVTRARHGFRLSGARSRIAERRVVGLCKSSIFPF